MSETFGDPIVSAKRKTAGPFEPAVGRFSDEAKA
jgi:hypothetical protein